MLARLFPTPILLLIACSFQASPVTGNDAGGGNRVGDGKLLAWDHWEQRHQPTDPTQPSIIKPVVLIVPGMLNGDDSMSIFKQRFSDERIPAALFRYESTLGVEAVAKKLTAFLTAEAQRYPNRQLILLTHSMGGVVCRRAIEDPAFGLNCVRKLIMVAPPNAGSTLATLRGETIKELAEGLAAQELVGIVGKQGPGVINETLGLYTGQAQVDLTPDSELLKTVNSFQRNPNVRYTVIAGTKAPIPPLALNAGGLLLQRFGFGNGGVADRFTNLVKTINRNEWINGRGDGAVTIESTQLENVEDQIELPFGHCDTCRDPVANANTELILNVMKRLSMD